MHCSANTCNVAKPRLIHSFIHPLFLSFFQSGKNQINSFKLSFCGFGWGLLFFGFFFVVKSDKNSLWKSKHVENKIKKEKRKCLLRRNSACYPRGYLYTHTHTHTHRKKEEKEIKGRGRKKRSLVWWPRGMTPPVPSHNCIQILRIHICQLSWPTDAIPS